MSLDDQDLDELRHGRPIDEHRMETILRDLGRPDPDPERSTGTGPSAPDNVP